MENMIKIQGNGVSARVILDSISSVTGTRITTMELEYPRIIHSEFLTHRMFSRNAASSRAIPFDKMLNQLDGRPVRFGAAQKGMQDTGTNSSNRVVVETFTQQQGDLFELQLEALTPKAAWEDAKTNAVAAAKAFKEAGYHKQVYNRLLEPFQMIKVVVTATEWDNFFWLRLDKAADPTIQELARCMDRAYDFSHPIIRGVGEWHLPYVASDGTYFYVDDDDAISPEDAIRVSAARCAAVSYRNENYGLDKCLEIYDRLVGADRKHASSCEHQAKVMVDTTNKSPDNWEYGVTHMDKSGILWSGNFRNFIQFRKTLQDENHTNA